MATAVVRYRVGTHTGTGETGIFLGEREKRIALSAADATTRVFAQEENYESKNEGETNREGEWNNGHGMEG
jgi:hypothetical protein